MTFGEIFQRAWSGVKSPGSWGFLASFYGLFMVVGAILVVAFVAIVGVGTLSSIGDSWAQTTPDFSAIPGSFFIALVVVTLAAILLLVPIGVAFDAGLVHMTNEVVQGRRARFADGWKAGLQQWPRVFVVDFALWAIGFVLAGVVVVIIGVVAVGMFGSAGSNDTSALAGVSVGLCCGSGLLYVLWLIVAMLLQAWQGLSARYVVIGGMSGGAALGAGFSTLKSSFKRVMLLAFALLGLSLAVSVVFATISLPFDTLSSSSSNGAAAIGSLLSVIISLVSMVASAAVALFTYSAWTAFFRDAIGLDPRPQAHVPLGYIPSVAPGYAPPAPSAYAPPVPPAPPIVDAGPASVASAATYSEPPAPAAGFAAPTRSDDIAGTTATDVPEPSAASGSPEVPSDVETPPADV